MRPISGQPKFITEPTYDQLHNAAVTIVREARTHAWIDAVVALCRGGLMFGMVASEKLNVPLIPVSYSSKDGAGDGRNHDNVLPNLASYKTVLLVDDLADSGNTLKEVVADIQKQGVQVITAAYHYKESSCFKPDFYWWRIPADSDWIVYPHERS